MEENTYQPTFTSNNIKNLREAIFKAITSYTDEQGKEKINVYVIVEALIKEAFEWALTLQKKDRNKSIENMNILVRKMYELMEKERKDLKTNDVTEILAAIHLSSILNEDLARKYDYVLKRILEETSAKLVD